MNFNDLEVLKKIGSSVQWVAIALIFLGGLLQISKFLIDKKIDSIKELIIRDFASNIRVKFSGKWSSRPYPDQIISPVNHQYYIDLHGEGPNHSIKLYATLPYQFYTIDQSHAIFESRQAINPGSYPLGKHIDELSAISKILVHIPFILYNSIEDNKVVVEGLEMTFIVNGEERYTLVTNETVELLITAQGSIGWANLLIQLAPNALPTWLRNKAK